MKTKLIIIIAVFLLLVPLRLPIAVLFIQLITHIATLAGDLSDNILVANVIVTKLVYDIALSSVSIFNIERLSRDIKGRQPTSGEDMFWWTGAVIAFLACYLIFDMVGTYELYFELS